MPSCFSLLVLFTHIHHHKWCSCDGLSNGVLSHSTNVMCHPPLSNTITPSLLPPITTDTHHVGSAITPNAKHPDTAIVKATQQMHTHKDKADVHSVLGVVPVVVPMVVWIAWWACVDVVFCVIFHTRPSIVASDVCRCVPHPNHHQTLGCAVGQSCIHFASCQSPTTPCLSPCHTSPSCFFHNCSSFFSMSSSPSSFCDH